VLTWDDAVDFMLTWDDAVDMVLSVKHAFDPVKYNEFLGVMRQIDT
jgi:hypothetical protein